MTAVAEVTRNEERVEVAEISRAVTPVILLG